MPLSICSTIFVILKIFAFTLYLVCVSTCVHVYVYEHMCACVCVRMCVCVSVHAHMHLNIQAISVCYIILTQDIGTCGNAIQVFWKYNKLSLALSYLYNPQSIFRYIYNVLVFKIMLWATLWLLILLDLLLLVFSSKLYL